MILCVLVRCCTLHVCTCMYVLLWSKKLSCINTSAVVRLAALSKLVHVYLFTACLLLRRPLLWFFVFCGSCSLHSFSFLAGPHYFSRYPSSSANCRLRKAGENALYFSLSFFTIWWNRMASWKCCSTMALWGIIWKRGDSTFTEGCSEVAARLLCPVNDLTISSIFKVTLHPLEAL